MIRIVIGIVLICLFFFGFVGIILGIKGSLINYTLGGSIVFLIPGILLMFFGLQSRKKKRLSDSIANKNQVHNIPPSVKVENDNIMKYFEFEFNEESETRRWDSEPSFSNVLTPLNDRQFNNAIKEGLKIIPKYSDFDLLYYWVGGAYRDLSILEQSKNILLEGLKKSRRKCLLLLALAETTWRMNLLEETIYYLSQALQSSVKGEIHNAYLLLHYISKGIGLDQEAILFIQQVDKLKAGQYRLNPTDANKLINFSRNISNVTYKEILSKLCEKYCA